jgi:chromosome segregation ATPase
MPTKKRATTAGVMRKVPGHAARKRRLARLRREGAQLTEDLRTGKISNKAANAETTRLQRELREITREQKKVERLAPKKS